MISMIFLLAAAVAAQDWVLDSGLPSRVSDRDLARGKGIYAANCQSCHGPDGDDTRIEGVTPLAGLSLRLGDPRNRNFGGPSFRARGRVYPPDEARVLMAYILTLRGEKGFSRPDALVSPCLLDRKRLRRTYLLLDVREESEFRKGHISSAVNLPPKAFATFDRPGLAPDLRNRIVVLCDDGAGLQAARAWWMLSQSGHTTVAVLDGGFARWVSEDRDITRAVSPSLPSKLLVNSASPKRIPQPAPTPPASELRFDWRRTVNKSGFSKASEILDYLRSTGFKGPGRYRAKNSPASTDLLAFQLHLLGYSVERTSPEEIAVR